MRRLSLKRVVLNSFQTHLHGSGFGGIWAALSLQSGQGRGGGAPDRKTGRSLEPGRTRRWNRAEELLSPQQAATLRRTTNTRHMSWKNRTRTSSGTAGEEQVCAGQDRDLHRGFRVKKAAERDVIVKIDATQTLERVSAGVGCEVIE